jgi:glycosyltransferase involved in cell wall biosynthesis
MGFRCDERMRTYAVEAARNASYIFAISEYVKEEVLDLYPVVPEKVAVISNGYDHNLFYPRKVNRTKLLEKFELADYDGLPIITFAGKISKTKGVDYLLMANKIIQKEREVILVIFGAGKIEDVLESDLKDEYELKNTFFMGHQSPEVLSSFHNIARLSVLPSRTEGFGIAALEAMGCGTPLVASKTGGLGVLIVGALTPVGDFQEIAKQILKILDMNENDYLHLRKSAYNKAREHSWKKIVEKRLKIYETLR